MRKLILLVILVLFASTAFAQKTPTFKQYPATMQKATAKKVNLAGNRSARMFRTNLKRSLAKGVNFAGRYIISTWGCGTDCIMSGIIDGRTGNVFFPQQLEGVSVGFGELSDEERLEFKKNSRLLIVRGRSGEDSKKYGVAYYRWNGSTLALLKFVKKDSRD